MKIEKTVKEARVVWVSEEELYRIIHRAAIEHAVAEEKGVLFEDAAIVDKDETGYGYLVTLFPGKPR